MSRKRRANLKQDLLKAAERCIDEGGPGALSLRKLAKDVGVTTMATYHHFANKKDLLVQVAINGFNDLEQRIAKASENGETSAEVVEKVMQAYYKFARERRHAYHLMFGQEMAEARHSIPELKQAAQQGFYVFARIVKSHMDKNGHELNLEAGGMCFWAILHGRVSLAEEGTILDEAKTDGKVKNLIDDAIKNVFHIDSLM